MEIIIRGKTRFGRTRSEQESNLRKEWGPTMSDEQVDRTRFLEKKLKDKSGSADNFVGQSDVKDGAK